MKKQYKFPLLLALSFHAALLYALIHEIPQQQLLPLQVQPVIIQATAVSQAQLNKELAAIQQQAKTKRLKVLANKKALEKKLLDAKVKKLALIKAAKEKKRIAELKKKQQLDSKLAAEKLANEKLAAEKLQREEVLATALAEKAAAESAENQQRILSEVEKFKAMIVSAISQRWFVPDNVTGEMFCKLLIHLGPGGTVLSVDLIRSSGDPALDRSAEVAVFKSSPLPVPEDPEIFDNFRELRLTVRPEGILST